MKFAWSEGLKGSEFLVIRLASEAVINTKTPARARNLSATLLIRTLKLPLLEEEHRFVVDSHEPS